jgi:hypothetical protein
VAAGDLVANFALARGGYYRWTLDLDTMRVEIEYAPDRASR